MIGSWEKFTIEEEDDKISLKSCHGKYLSAQPDGSLQWNRDECAAWEWFTKEDQEKNRFYLKSAHGKYMVMTQNLEENGNRKQSVVKCDQEEPKFNCAMKFYPNKEFKDKKKFLMCKHEKTHGLGEKGEGENIEIRNDPTKFRMVKGLTGQPGTVSFESKEKEGHYLRHAGFVVWLHKLEDQAD